MLFYISFDAFANKFVIDVFDFFVIIANKIVAGIFVFVPVVIFPTFTGLPISCNP